MDLSLRQIRAFVLVAELKSFTRAAVLLHVSQPALTVQIRNLEGALRSRLFDRNSRSVELTRAGHDLLPSLKRALQDLDDVVAETHAASAGHGGVVRVASLPSFAASLLPEVILACRGTNPGLGFVVRDAVVERVTELVRDEDVDIGITGGRTSAVEVDVLHRMDDRLCIVFPKGHAIERRHRIRAMDLIDLPLVLTDPATSVRAHVDAAFLALGKRPQVVCEATYMMTAVAMVRAGLGITILPSSAREIRAEPTLMHRPIDGPAFVRSIMLVKKRNRTLPNACTPFLAACIAAMRNSRCRPVSAVGGRVLHGKRRAGLESFAPDGVRHR